MWIHVQREVGRETLSFKEMMEKNMVFFFFKISTLAFKRSNTSTSGKPGTPVLGLVKAL